MYCTQCGAALGATSRFCGRCGAPQAPVGRPSVAQEFGQVAGTAFRGALADDRAAAAQARQAARRDRSIRRGANELHQMFLGCIGTFAFLASFLPGMALSSLGLVILGFGLLTGAGAVWMDVRRGRVLARSLTRVGVTGLLMFGLIFAFGWFFTVYLPHQPGLFTINIPKPRPTP